MSTLKSYCVLLLLSSSIFTGNSDLLVLVKKTESFPYGVVISIDNYLLGNSSMMIDVKGYIFNNVSVNQMKIYYNETTIKNRFNHSFSMGEEFIFFVKMENGKYHLVADTSHPPFLEYTKENSIEIAVNIAEGAEVDGGPGIEKMREDVYNEKYCQYIIIIIIIVVIMFILKYLKL